MAILEAEYKNGQWVAATLLLIQMWGKLQNESLSNVIF